MTNKKIMIKLKNILSLLIVIIIYSSFIIHYQQVFAQTLNNKFGIHLAQPHLNDLKKVKELVNSNGGDWGYVTLVIQENDRNLQKWQEIFDLLRKYHLIPIVRLATKPEGENWRRPKIEDVSDWVNFLDSLNWVVKNRYIVLFNEPNHATEWGGEVDPQDYAKVAFAFARALKEKNQDFFVMLAGFDASAPQQPPKYWDEEIFLKQMLSSIKELINNNQTQKNRYQSQRKSNNNISIYCPKIDFIHNDLFSNLNAKTKQNIPSKKSEVNIKTFFSSFIPPKLGAIKIAAIQAADKLTKKSDKTLKNAFFSLIEKIFIRNILAQEKINFFNYIDGWASHSYPNPGFSGSVYDWGRGTIRTYQWELELLRSLGVDKDLPVFITETGWKRKDIGYSILDIGRDWVAQNFKIAFEDVWLNDKRVQAVTPFVFDYQSEPFFGFSWKKPGSDDFYSQYYLVQSLPKQKGNPEQIEKGKISFDLPKELVEQSTYNFKIKLKNEGQGYWEDNDYLLLVNSYLDKKKIEVLFDSLGEIAPKEEKEVGFYLKTKDKGEQKLKFILTKNDKNIIESQDWQFKILPLPSLKFEAFYWPWGKAEGDDFEIQIFDWEERLVFKKKNIVVKKGVGFVDNIKNITLSDLYRIVLIKKGYLPRQLYYVFNPSDNKIKFKKLLPFDLNGDGRFDINDLFFVFYSLAKFGKSI